MQTATQLLAHDGPGPWVLIFPLVWAAVVVGGITLLRRTVWRGRRGPRAWNGRTVPTGAHTAGGPSGDSPVDLLARRYAEGSIDDEEYWRRLSVLNEARGGGGSEGDLR